MKKKEIKKSGTPIEEADYDVTPVGDGGALELLTSPEEIPAETAEEESKAEESKAQESQKETKGEESKKESKAEETKAEETKEDEPKEDEADEDEAGEEDGGASRRSLAAEMLAMAQRLLSGKVSEEDLQPLRDIVLSKKAIEEAYAAGEIAGRNARIEVELLKPEAELPDISGAPLASTRRLPGSIFDLAADAR